MTRTACKRSGSVLLGFLSVEICHRIEMESCNFVMLGGNYGLSASVRQRRKELEYAVFEIIFTLFTMFSERNRSFLVWVFFWESVCVLCHSFSKSHKMHEGHACELFQFKLPAMRKLHSCIFHCYCTDGLPSPPNVWKGYFRRQPVFSRCSTVPGIPYVTKQVFVIIIRMYLCVLALWEKWTWIVIWNSAILSVWQRGGCRGSFWGALVVCFTFLPVLFLFWLEGLACLCFPNFKDHLVLKVLEAQF